MCPCLLISMDSESVVNVYDSALTAGLSREITVLCRLACVFACNSLELP